MMRSDFHPLQQVEAMCIKPLHTRIERELVAIFSSPFCYEPIEELSAKASRPIALTCHKIVA